MLGLTDGRNQTDGYRLMETYRVRGLQLHIIENSLESGILNISQRMQSGRLKVFASLNKFLQERRLYRRDERDQIVKEGDHLQDAARCLVNGLSHLRTKPKPPTRRPAPPMGANSWMAF